VHVAQNAWSATNRVQAPAYTSAGHIILLRLLDGTQGAFGQLQVSPHFLVFA